MIIVSKVCRIILVFSLVSFICSGCTYSNEKDDDSLEYLHKQVIDQVSLHEEIISIDFKLGSESEAKLLEIMPYMEFSKERDYSVIWEGALDDSTIEFPRYDDDRDRAYSMFLLVDANSMEPLGAEAYVTDFSNLDRRYVEFYWYDSVKGLSCPVFIDGSLSDVKELGVKYVTVNINLNQVLDMTGQSVEYHEVDGIKYHINTSYINHLDRHFKAFTDSGINITAVLNNLLPPSRERTEEWEENNPLIHPQTNVEEAPTRIGAINIATERGYRAYRAIIEYLGERYSRHDKRYGLVTGFVVGNELQQHWVWYNMGRSLGDYVVEHYVRALRVTDIALRQVHPDLRTYVSMDHHWNLKGFHDNPLKEIKGNEFLEMVNNLVKARGNMPWHVAQHPYPRNLFEPDFWNDGMPLRFDAPRITFDNIEVLPAFLSKDRFLYNGQQRRIALTEQGFHSSNGMEGEKLQAAAYAKAYFKVQNLPGIDAFMLHRHVDHPHEGGLLLGIWTHDGSSNLEGAGRKKYIWEVFKYADTDMWEETFEFAKPIIGIDDWQEALPQEVPCYG